MLATLDAIRSALGQTMQIQGLHDNWTAGLERRPCTWGVGRGGPRGRGGGGSDVVAPHSTKGKHLPPPPPFSPQTITSHAAAEAKS